MTSSDVQWDVRQVWALPPTVCNDIINWVLHYFDGVDIEHDISVAGLDNADNIAASPAGIRLCKMP